MKKKFICTVCGYVYEGDAAPEKCPQCKAPASKFKEVKEDEARVYVTEHVIGVAKGCPDDIWAGLKAHFEGECTEVGMYLAMSRQADREGYPEIAEAFKRYALKRPTTPAASPNSLASAYGTPRPTLRSVLKQNAEHATARWKSPNAQRQKDLTPSTTPFTKWLRTKHVTDAALKVC